MLKRVQCGAFRGQHGPGIALQPEQNRPCRNGIAVLGQPLDPDLAIASAEKGNGAFLRNFKLRVSGRNQIEAAMIATGSPASQLDKRDLFMAEYTAVQMRIPGVRRFGAAALDMAYVAAGRLDGFWERGLHSWDMAAGHLIVKEAQGRSTDISGAKSPVHEGNVLCANGLIYDELKTILSKASANKDAA